MVLQSYVPEEGTARIYMAPLLFHDGPCEGFWGRLRDEGFGYQ